MADGIFRIRWSERRLLRTLFFNGLVFGGIPIFMPPTMDKQWVIARGAVSKMLKLRNDRET